MDFDKDEAKLNTHWNKFNNCVNHLAWIDKEIKLHEAIITKTQEFLFFLRIDTYLNEMKIEEHMAFDKLLEDELKVMNS